MMETTMRRDPSGKPADPPLYEPPAILTLAVVELLERIGPAQGYEGSLPGRDFGL